MSETTTESQPGDTSADQLNAGEAATNTTGEAESPTPQGPDYVPEPALEVETKPAAEQGLATPAAGDGEHNPPTPPEPSDFAVAWMKAADLWIHGHLRNSPLAEATQAWNHVMAKLPLLGALVEAEMSSKKE
jgi:hypothetical protein